MSFQNSKRPLLKGYTTGFVNGGQKRHLMIWGQGSYGLCLTGNIMFRVNNSKARIYCLSSNLLVPRLFACPALA